MPNVVRVPAKRPRIVNPTIYPAEEKVGEDILQRWIAELLRPLVERWFRERRIKALVGADQFIYYRPHSPIELFPTGEEAERAAREAALAVAAVERAAKDAALLERDAALSAKEAALSAKQAAESAQQAALTRIAELEAKLRARKAPKRR